MATQLATRYPPTSPAGRARAPIARNSGHEDLAAELPEADPTATGGDLPIIVASSAARVDSAAGGAAVAFALGWQMAELYRREFCHRQPPPDPPARLPGIGRLAEDQKIELGLDEVEAALARLAGPIADARLTLPSVSRISEIFDDRHIDTAEGRRSIYHLHLDVLRVLSATDSRLGRAYLLGRALADTCRPAGSRGEFLEGFSRFRLDQLRGWLNDLASVLPPHSAKAVLQALTAWQAWTANFPREGAGEESWSAQRDAVFATLDRQGELWRALLAGQKEAQDMLTAEAYVKASAALLARGRRLLSQFVSKFWPVVLLVLLATGVGIALLIEGGTSGTIGALAAIATALGLSWRGTAATLGRISGLVRQPLWGVELDAVVGQAATYLPSDPDLAVGRDLLEATPLCLRVLRAQEQRPARRRGRHQPQATQIAHLLSGKRKPPRGLAQGDRLALKYWGHSAHAPSIAEAQRWIVWAIEAGYVEDADADAGYGLTGDGARLAEIPRSHRDTARTVIAAAHPKEPTAAYKVHAGSAC